MVKDLTVVREEEDTRTHKIFHALEEACHTLDLSTPLWLDATVREFKKSGKCRFRQDNFMESVDFDFLEMQVLEEDSP